MNETSAIVLSAEERALLTGDLAKLDAEQRASLYQSVCQDCKQSLPRTMEFFNKRSVHSDGLDTRCRQCARARGNAYYATHSERICALQQAKRPRIRARERAYWAANQERKSVKDKRYRARHPEKEVEHNRRWYRTHTAEVREQLRAWQASHPEQVRAHTRKKNLRRRGAPLTVEAITYLKLIRHDPCCYCDTLDGPMEVEHIIPVANGGTSEWDNLTMSCRACNAAKSNKSLLKFLVGRSVA